MEQALAWHLRLRDADETAWEEFTAWLERDPAHNAAYEEVATRDDAQRRWQGTWDDAKHEWKGSLWDESEYYWAADEAADSLSAIEVLVEYTQVSFCGGVYVITPSAAEEAA